MLSIRETLKYGHLTPKIAQVIPWNKVCVDLIGSYTIKANDNTIMNFTCLTITDPATLWFEITQLTTKDITYIQDKDKEKNTNVIVDETSVCVAQLSNKSWLRCYARTVSSIYVNGSEFKLFLENRDGIHSVPWRLV